MKKRQIGMLMCAVLATAALAGCESASGEGKPRGTVTKEDDGEEDDEGNGQDEGSKPGGNPDEGNGTGNVAAPEGLSLVHDVEGLLEAIEPGAKIVMEPGTYMLSDYLTAQQQDPDENWKKIESKGYVSMESVYDGVELVVTGVDGLSIIGRSNDRADVQILTEPRYASLFAFHGSDDILLSNLTIGHTMRGDCGGNVLDFWGCHDVLVTNADIFGCGVHGIATCGDEASGDFRFYDTTIRDCSYGPFDLDAPWEGSIVFTGCELTGSEGGGICGDTRNGKLCFYDCVFGDRESENLYFRDDVVKENCSWGNIEIYPDIAEFEEGPTLAITRLKVAPFDDGVLRGTTWSGFSITDNDAGTTIKNGSWICFLKEGTVSFFQPEEFERALYWECDGHYSADITLYDGQKWGGVTLYYDPDSEGPMYMNLSTDYGTFWFYKAD
ncbi:MAG: right-handed parallel beta-helix repeat-containing protein [Lachnospiraceae bacterium]|nr:right-handed parallel beta-helix repeat-containing protein [Lachnospiraceae bacterium]